MSERAVYWDPKKIISSLLGSWSLSRSIDNGTSMAGTATFSDGGNRRYPYVEHGTLQLADGQIVNAERRYIFEEAESGFAVLFAETPPRLFHRIALTREGANWVGDAVHLCNEDRYESRYEFRPDASFTVRHAVRGPRKQYVIRTRYTRSPLA